MIDISHKISTLREATAVAIVKVSEEATIEAIEKKQVPKGDVFEMAKAAGLLATKKTAETIPDCHPIPIEHTRISYAINGLEIYIQVEVKTIYKTGVEVEAMHGASVVALTFYDMLKPIDGNIEIRSIRLISKKGGKSDFRDKFRKDLNAAVIVCSDTISAGHKKDKAGITIVEKLKSNGVEVRYYKIIPDDKEAILGQLYELSNEGIDLIIYTGGTGLSSRDVTPEAIAPALDREIPGIMEAARNYGQQRTPYSMLSRGIAGVKDHSLVLTLPGSTKGASETMDVLFPSILHIYRIFTGALHD